MGKHYLSANEYQRDCWRLASLIRASGWRPDWIVGLWRGGAPVAIQVHEFLKATGWNAKHVPLKCWSYSAIEKNEDEVRFFAKDEVLGLFKAGERVLFVDDVFDTGKTAAAVLSEMKATDADARIACVYWKKAKNKTSIIPDFTAEESGDEWLVFPHEIDGLTTADLYAKDAFLAAEIARFQ